MTRSAADACAYASSHMGVNPPTRMLPSARTAMSKRRSYCSNQSTLQDAAFAVMGIGLAVAIVGGILFLTDHTGSTPAAAHARRNRPVQWLAAPVMSPTYQGASFGLRF